MRKPLTIFILAFGLTFLVAGQTQARRFPRPIPYQLCWAAIGARIEGQVTIKGRVAGVRFPGRGLIIKTSNGQRTVYGLGPRWYWRKKGVARPWLGERIKVRALKIQTPKGSYLVACEIKTPKGRIRLRDPETGLPLWKRGCGARERRTWWHRTCMNQ